MVRCAGTRDPPNTSATSTSAWSSGAPSSQARASPACSAMPEPSGSGSRSVTSSSSPRSASTTSCREPGRVAARYRGSVSAPPPRCTASTARPASATVSRTYPSRRAYSNSRYSGSSRSTYDCGAPSTVSSQARSRSTSGISLAVPWSVVRVTGIDAFTSPLSAPASPPPFTPAPAHPTATTVPAPTVRPPSRTAKPSPGSNGTSRPSSTLISTVSPGRATATSPRSTEPTTSAVLM